MSPTITLACVIPCYNAGGRVRSVAEAALRETPHVWVVDDGCTDGSAPALADLPLRIVRHDRNLGKGHAILTGLRAALADPAISAVVLLDADGQHDAAAIPTFAARLTETGAAMVIGGRVFDGSHVPLRSRVGNTVTALVTRFLLGENLPDTQCGYRMLSRSFAETVIQRVGGGRYETEMEMIVLAIRGGYPLATTPIRTVYEEGNASSHFRKVSDSFRIYARLLRAMARHAPGAARQLRSR